MRKKVVSPNFNDLTSLILTRPIDRGRSSGDLQTRNTGPLPSRSQRRNEHESRDARNSQAIPCGENNYVRRRYPLDNDREERGGNEGCVRLAA